MANQTLIVSATSKGGNVHTVAAEIVAGRLVGTFKRTDVFGTTKVSKPMPIQGDLTRLATFSTRQPGMFMAWVNKKLGVK